MFGKLKEHLTTELNSIKEQKLYKYERIIESSQGAERKMQLLQML